MSACRPHVPISAACVLTRRFPPSVVADDHADKLPDSKPSAKMMSEPVAVIDTVVMAEPVSPPLSVTLAVIVWLPTERLDMLHNPPVPIGPSRLPGPNKPGGRVPP